ncbi:isochorismatase family protein [Pseudonocardia eucalypti]|uniref:Isochorismatase family protein n=1 Tax=Pseudonocardia eucalypti TaxID=648755 RepID=A0ABP9QHA4_9PSEU|nr:nicotinamidase-related amidase [Pseudonocardia eucalypti]
MAIHHFTADDAAILLIDHQVGTISWVRSMDRELLIKHATLIAEAAVGLNIPLVLTSSMEDHPQGPLVAGIQEAAPDAFAKRVQRTGVVNALDDPGFADAVKATGRRNLVIAGVTNDVCTVYPVLTALEQGYNVQVIADAGGSLTVDGDRYAIRRMERAGADVLGTNQLLTQFAGNWTTAAGAAIQPLALTLIPTE